ncbi:MAG: 23S rRNA (guanosine(2251)-2'-O)-methyltransferase RlmB [Alphaproteobacteria bacterium]
MAQRKHPDQPSGHASGQTGTKKPNPHRSSGYRPAAKPDADRLWLYGLHAVVAALRNPERQKLQFLATSAALATLAAHIKNPDPAPEIRDSEKIARLLPGAAVHQGLALQVRPLPEPDLEQICARQLGEPPRLVVVLDQLTDPQNVGAVLRSCAAFGAAAVILTGRHAPPASGVLAKAASGALDLVPVIRVINLARALEQLAGLGYWRVGLDSEALQPIAEIDLSGNIAIVLGAEGGGLRQLTSRKCDFLARIPADGQLASLNVSNAAAIVLYEVARRRSTG